MNYGWYSYMLSLTVLTAKLSAFGLSMWRDRSQTFRCVRVWLGVLAAEDVALFLSLHAFGFRSLWYARLYYGFDLISILCGLFVVLRLAEIAFQESRIIPPLLRRGALAILIGLILISAFGVAAPWGSRPATMQLFDFAQQLEQNINVAGMLAAVLLWGSINALAIPGITLRRITAAIGVSYSAGALSWSFYSLFGHRQMVSTLLALISIASIALIGGTLAFHRTDEAPDSPGAVCQDLGAVRLL